MNRTELMQNVQTLNQHLFSRRDFNGLELFSKVLEALNTTLEELKTA